ncbi:MAG: peptidase domain-containing ABC transporter [Cyanobacteria bacterium P01_C01_bin.72]
MKYQLIKQYSEEDCGAACIASISKHYGKSFTINHCREVIGTRQTGSTLLGLKQGAEVLNFNTRAIKTSVDVLAKNALPLPAIIHWKGYHWVILYGKKGKKYIIADPAIGIMYLDRKALLDGWKDGVMLLLEPDCDRFNQQTDDRQKIKGLAHFLRRVLPYKGILSQTLLINGALGLISLGSPFLLQILTDDVLVRGDSQLLTRVAIAVVIMHLVNSCLQLVQSNLVTHFAQRIKLNLIFEFGRQILRLPLTYYETHRSGEIISRLEDIEDINQLISQAVVSLPSQFFIAFISLGIMISYNFQLTCLAIVIALLMTLSTVAFLPILQQKIRQTMALSAENQGILVETFKGSITLKTTTAAPQFWSEFQNQYSRLANFTFKTIQISFINGIFANLVANIGTIALLWFGSKLVIEESLTIGMLLAFNSMNANVNSFVNNGVSFVDEFSRAKTATRRLNEVIQATPEQKDGIRKPAATIKDNTDIICSNLNFYHTGRVDLLKDFNLTIPGGKVVALIGKSGCGKSTVSKIIAGLYSPQSGNVRFGDYNQQDLALDCLRQQIVLVPQEAHFWSRSIIDNFRLGNPNIGFDQIVKACKVTGADEFIRKLPDKYLTILGEFGSNLSGGQRQRLALARAIVNNPPVIILDESTGALDPVSETEVLQKLLAYRRGKSTIIISHRPRVISQADWIVMLEEGKVILQGDRRKLNYQTGEHQQFLVS